MRYEDTVMNEDGKRPCVFTDKGKYRTPWSIADKTAKAQAEISWNLRMDDIRKQLKEFNQRGLAITEAIDLLQ